MKSFTPHLQRQPRLQGLVSTVLVDSPHGDHSLAVHTVTALAKHSFWGTWMLGGPFSGYWTEHRASKTHSNPTCYNPAQCACEGKILRQRNDTRTLRASVHS